MTDHQLLSEGMAVGGGEGTCETRRGHPEISSIADAEDLAGRRISTA